MALHTQKKKKIFKKTEKNSKTKKHKMPFLTRKGQEKTTKLNRVEHFTHLFL